MDAVGVKDYAGYVDRLEVDPDEFTQLFNTILINVTGFFRDPDVWDFLSKEVAPRIVSSKREGEAIRVWCAGTATGEEAYTVAIILADQVGRDAFFGKVKIYATDVDEDALSAARQGT